MAVNKDVPTNVNTDPTNITDATKEFKVIIIGDAAVGKTSLLSRFCGEGIETSKLSFTDIRKHIINVDGEFVQLSLWDTNGQERFHAVEMASLYYRNVNAVVLVYDVTVKSTFESLKRWISICEKNGLGDRVPKFIVGNKYDCYENLPQVDTNLAKKFAKDNEMPLFMTSALANPGNEIENIIFTIAKTLKNQKPSKTVDKSHEPIIRVGTEDLDKNSDNKCCKCGQN